MKFPKVVSKKHARRLVGQSELSEDQKNSLLKSIDEAPGGDGTNCASALSEATEKPKASPKPVPFQNKKVKEGSIDVAKANTPEKKADDEGDEEDKE